MWKKEDDKIELVDISEPACDCSGVPVGLTDQTMLERKQRVLEKMKERKLDTLVFYCDVEHGMNFEYLVGFFTRFEEALLVLHQDGSAFIVAGNENLNKVSKSRIPAKAVHAPHFSLPNQPAGTRPFGELLKDTDIRPGSRVGVVGWKNFTGPETECSYLFDIPHFILAALRVLVGDEQKVTNETDLMIGEEGVRRTNNANELAHYEFGASLASDCMMQAMNLLKPGVSEMELGDALVRHGQHTNVVTIASSGARFVKGNMYPTEKRSSPGDQVSLTVGYKGGLSSRAGYAVYQENELPDAARNYLEELVFPYYQSYCRWLEELAIGKTGGELYALVQEIMPQEEFHWGLCPGHLTADEEWMCSPIYNGSKERLKSGMLFQIDIIPSKPGMGGVSAESTVALADEFLRNEIQMTDPGLWNRIERRRSYLMEVLNIRIGKELLPMCGSVAYLRPFLYSRRMALRRGGVW